MQDAIQHYHNVRTANAFDLTVAQVERANGIEAQADAHVPAWASDFDRRPFAVELLDGNVHVRVWIEEWMHEGVIGRDGTVKWG